MSRNNSFKEFHKDYKAYLLLTPHENYSLAYFADVEKRFFLDVDNESLADELFGDDDDFRKRIKKDLREVQFINANFPEIKVEKELLGDLNATVPKVGVDAGLNIDRSKVLEYKFGNIKAKVLDNSDEKELRLKIERAYEKLKGKEKRKFKRATIIEELFYADEVHVVVDKSFKIGAEVEANIKDLDEINLQANIGGSNNHNLTFKNSSGVPFAAKVITLKDF